MARQPGLREPRLAGGCRRSGALPWGVVPSNGWKAPGERFSRPSASSTRAKRIGCLAACRRFTTASVDSVRRLEDALRDQGIDPTVHEPTAASRLSRDRVAVIPWLDRTRPLRGSRILEVGCGRGASTVALAEQGAELIALDHLLGVGST